MFRRRSATCRAIRMVLEETATRPWRTSKEQDMAMSMVEVVAEGLGWALLGATSGKKVKGQEKAGLMAEERRYSFLLTVLPQQPHRCSAILPRPLHLLSIVPDSQKDCRD